MMDIHGRKDKYIKRVRERALEFGMINREALLGSVLGILRGCINKIIHTLLFNAQMVSPASNRNGYYHPGLMINRWSIFICGIALNAQTSGQPIDDLNGE